MKIALGKSAFSNKLKQSSTTVIQLFKKLSKPDIRPKKDGPYFVFASFKKDRRNAKNIDKFYGATIDLDDTDLSILQIQKIFSRYTHLIHTTHSHKAPGKGDRYRLVLPYKQPVSIEQHREVMQHLFFKLGTNNVDTSSKTVSIPMYLPSVPKERKHKFECHFKTDGHLYNAAIISISPEQKWKMREMQETNEHFDINKDANEGERNDSIARLVGKMINNGMDMNLILKSSQVWNETNCSPPLSTDEVETIVNSIYKAHKRNNKDSGWSHDEILRRIKSAQRPEEDYEILSQLVAGSSNKLKMYEKEILSRALAKVSKLPIGVVKEDLKSKSIDQNALVEDEDNEKLEFSAKTLRQEFNHWIYLRRDDKLYNSKNGIIYKPEGFNKSHSSKIEKGSLLAILLKYNCIKQADILQFNPSEGKVFTYDYITYANTYIQPELFPVPGDVQPMLDHLSYLLPNVNEQCIILDWMAYLIQYPGKKIRWMPIIKGYKRIGKSLLESKILTPLLGNGNVKPISSKIIKSDFNGWQIDCQLVVFHELKIGERRYEKMMFTDSLKEFISESRIMAHRKGIDPYTTLNKANAIGFTNHEDALMITQDEERWCMFRSEARPKDREYYDNFCEWADTHKEEMLYFFEERDISNFNPNGSPTTKYTEEVKDQSLTWPGSVLSVAIKDPDHFFNTDGVTTWEAIVEYVRSESSGKDILVTDNLIKASSSQGYILKNCLTDMGFRKWEDPKGRERIRIAGKLSRIWITPKFIDTKFPTNLIKQIIPKQKTIYDFEEE